MGCHNEYQPSTALRRIPMAAIGCAFAAALLAYHPAAGAQQADGAAAHPLIVFAQEHAAGASPSALSTEQAATLDTIRADPAASGIRFGRSAPTAIAAALDARTLSIVVPAPSASGASPETADAVIAFTGVDVEHSGEDLVSLYARDDATDSEVALVVQGPDVLGYVRRGAELWRLTPLGDGTTAVYRYDTSKFRMHPPGWDPGSGMDMNMAPGKRSAEDAGAEADTGDIIDVMVVYTRAARTKVGNADAAIRLAFDNARRHYENSRIPFRLRLVHSYQTAYTESGDIGDDLEAIQERSDGNMDDVHALRDRHGADLVHLLISGVTPRGGGTVTCGVAYYAHLREAAHIAFGVTAVECETAAKSTFTHEIGHNLGASHDPNNASYVAFPYGYGNCNEREGWATVMAYTRVNNECTSHIPYFSSPALRYQGVATGDAARMDNRRVLLETARTVANHRQSRNTGGGTHLLPYILAENTAGAHGFVRIVNRSAQAGTVTLTAIDDAGRNAGTETLSLAANGAIHFTSRDLERGNADKGLSGVGAPIAGHWRLVLTSSLDIQPLAYVRTTDGSFLTRIDDIEAEVEGSGNRYIVHFFNPGSARKKVSYLRLINPGSASTRITISAHDDQGRNRGPVSFSLLAGHARHVTVSELETGEGLDGRLGTGSGKWRLTVTATQPVQVMSLLRTPTGHLTNLSGVPAMTGTVTPPPPSTTPDLVVQSPSVSDSSLNAGQAFTLRATVRNQGDSRSAATTLRYYRSSDATISTADTRVGTDAVRGLDPSATSPESISLTTPSSAGTYYYGACVDAVSGESDTANNCSSGVRVTVTTSATRWGAIAAGWSIRCVYASWYALLNQRDRDSAISRVVSACQADGLDGCRLAMAFQQCGALAYGTSGGSRCDFIGGSGASRSAAEQDALSRCRADYSRCIVLSSSSGRASYCNSANALTMPSAEVQSDSGTADVLPGTSDLGPLLIPNPVPKTR